MEGVKNAEESKEPLAKPKRLLPVINNELLAGKSLDDLIIEGSLPSNDSSYGLISENKDLQKINKAIPMLLVADAIKPGVRDLGVEFRVPISRRILLV